VWTAGVRRGETVTGIEMETEMESRSRRYLTSLSLDCRAGE
jgi:hypothetical protein